MVGIKDGRMLEDASVPYSKLEIHPDTLYVQISVYDLKMAALDAIDAALDDRITDLENDATLANHMATTVPTAHGIQANSITYDKINPQPASYSQLTSHTGLTSIHFTLGGNGSATTAAKSDHSHDYSLTFAPLVHANRHQHPDHGGIGGDILTGTHTINVTGFAQTAYYSA